MNYFILMSCHVWLNIKVKFFFPWNVWVTPKFLCFLHFQACQKALIAHYGEEFNSFHLAMNDKDEFTVETDVDLGLIASEQRIVELDKVWLFRG